jgi:hypothetical protein
MLWTPVLRGEAASAARGALEEIIAELDRVPDAARCPADIALFWAYAAGATDDAAAAAAYDAAVANLVAHVDLRKRLALHQGLAGTGWILSHLSDGAIDGISAIDDKLLAIVDRPGPWPHSYDLVHGISGLAVYFLDRLAVGAERAPHAVQLIVRHLRAMAETTPAGTTWFSQPEQIGAGWDELIPHGCYNCGVAHGVPGAVAALARIAATAELDDDTRAVARQLAIGALAWMRSIELPPDPRGRYPNWIAPGVAPSVTRPGWCYGDPGIAVVLWTAASRLGEPVDRWRDLAREWAQRPVELFEVSAPGLCHGAIGLAHLANRCFQATREPIFADAVERWIEVALGRRRPGCGPGGFVLDYGRDTPAGSQDLLGGATGVGLGLLAALGDTEPGWDRLLGCDLPSSPT